MARQSTTTREALAESVVTDNTPVTPEPVVIPPIEESIGMEAVDYFTGDSDRFGQARVAYAASQAGHKDQAIAEAVTAALTKRGRDPKVSASNGGASVTRVAINQRRLAWSDLIDAGVTPTESLIQASYALTTTGGTASAREKLIARVSKLTPDKKADAYETGAKSAVKSVRKSNADKRAEKAATKATEPGEGSVSANHATVEQVIAFVQVMATRDWSDQDKARLSEALAEVSAHLA